MKPLHEPLNDGFLEYGRVTPVRNGVGKRTGEAFVSEGKLAFKELSAREEDYRMAGLKGASLDIKVKTLCPPKLKRISKTQLTVMIDQIEYDVIEVDRDNQQRYLYFYLQEVGVRDE
ncbi:head-tail adaptor protein [Piscibacillus salipiscarius]|uniref:Head-tail adaptor protein n=1 Tax=Piscibacillus salipiscarius TaxID=299480 RepID=A0ABW5Q980_9BACI